MNYFEYHRAVEKESKEHRQNPQTREPTLSISEAVDVPVGTKLYTKKKDTAS